MGSLLKSVKIGFLYSIVVAVFYAASGCSSTHSEQARIAFAQRMKAKMELRERLHQALGISLARESRQLAPIYFDYGHYRIGEDQISTLYKHAQKLKASPVFALIIEGHCDARGTDKFNIALGQRRADSTRDFLVRAGVNAAQLKTVSFGSDRPFAYGQKESAWVQNRRVEFVWEEDQAL